VSHAHRFARAGDRRRVDADRDRRDCRQRRTAAGQELLIAETSAYGRTLFLDGLVQSAEADEPLYHEPLVHPALVLHGGPRRVLVGGTGEGASLREILRHRRWRRS
jgi:spermidine synthase